MDPEMKRPYTVPGGPKLLTVAAYLPLILLFVTLVFTVVPLSSDELADKIPLVIGSILGILAGEIVVFRIKNKDAKQCQKL
ncbi:MAG: hypothetical protein LBH07_02155, partial [Treponema sp.]|jgi:hypothetical protein|nr:hypothetical protein [Treponema sp.]